MPRLDRRQIPPVYAIADAEVSGLSLVETVVVMVRCGLPWIQLRAKKLGDEALSRQIERSLEAVEGTRAVLWVNDRADLAALYRSPGLHLGQEDLPPAAARRVVGESCWIGASTHGLDQLVAADRDPEVDLIALGPIFPTRHKVDPDPVVGLETLSEARRRTQKPLVAIGGVGLADIEQVLTAGADSAVLLGALCEGDIEANCRRVVATVGRFASFPC